MKIQNAIKFTAQTAKGTRPPNLDPLDKSDSDFYDSGMFRPTSWKAKGEKSHYLSIIVDEMKVGSHKKVTFTRRVPDTGRKQNILLRSLKAAGAGLAAAAVTGTLLTPVAAFLGMGVEAIFGGGGMLLGAGSLAATTLYSGAQAAKDVFAANEFRTKEASFEGTVHRKNHSVLFQPKGTDTLVEIPSGEWYTPDDRGGD